MSQKTVNLMYFKPSGKWYASGEYESKADLVVVDTLNMNQVSDEIREMRRTRTLPEITNGDDFYIVATAEYGYPIMIHPAPGVS